MSRWLSSVLEKVPRSPLRGIRRSQQQPLRTQRRLLRSLLRRAADTEWGRRYDFTRLAEASDVVQAYQEHVPLHDYDDLRADVERMRRGETDITWPGGFTHFAVSSGTASDGKVIPLSREMIDADRRFSVGVGLNYLAKTGNLRFLGGKHLTLPGSVKEDRQPGSLIGEVSGLLAAHKPTLVRWGYEAIPPRIWKMEDWDAKLRAVAGRTAERDIRLIVMAPTWALVLFKLVIERYNEVHGARATTLGQVWPNLQVFISGGVALSSYRALLEEQIGLDDMHFVETYGASEGFFALQNDLMDPAMLLHLDNGVFYEFVRLDEYNDPAPSRYTIADVEPNVRYALHVSTCSGLWSYDVGDVVRFTQTDPPKIVVAGRTSDMIDRYGEAVFGEEARTALRRACDALGGAVRDYHIAPREAHDDQLPAHQWLVEFAEPPDDLDRFAQLIDEHLRNVNRHYHIRRNAQAFGAPEIVPLPDNTFRRWMRDTHDRVSTQTKVPRMSEERDVADHILSLIGNMPKSRA